MGEGVQPASQFMANPSNWRVHPQAQRDAMRGALNEVGWVQRVIVNRRTGYLLDGHERVWQALQNGDAEVPYVEVDLDEAEEAYVLSTFDPIGAMAYGDKAQLASLLESVKTEDEHVTALLEETKAKAVDIPEEPPLTRWDVPDAVFPTDNDWGVPVLDAKLQADMLVAPVLAYGQKQSRKSRMTGTWHFYTEDYRFDALWTDPSNVVNSGCVAVVEPNFSTSPVMPKAVALWGIYRKRWLARYWQSFGIKVFVDVNVAEPLLDIALMGVPQGWKAYATRSNAGDIEKTLAKWRVACERAGTENILFVVYGGGEAAREQAKQRGWLYVWEQRDVAKGQADG